MNDLKLLLKKSWPLWAACLFILRPKRFINEYICTLFDYRLYSKSLESYKAVLRKISKYSPSAPKENLLIMAGKSMNIFWLQIWVVFGAFFQTKGHKVYAVTTRENPIQNLYLKIFRFELLFLEDMSIEDEVIPNQILMDINKLSTFRDFKEFECMDIPFGKMALSTFSRQRATGIMNLEDSQSKKEVCHWIKRLYKIWLVASRLYDVKNISMIFFTELFMEEYGAFYYAALLKNLNIVRFAGTVRDNAIVVQHLNRESDRTHFSSISKQTWNKVLGSPFSDVVLSKLEENFSDRYSARWALSLRNQPNTRIMSGTEARKLLGVSDNEKIAVIYSHILYDTLFFNGEDIFENYADWLVQSVRAACKNKKIRWFIKIHPSNLWRGELEQFHKGKYEEVRLIEEFVGHLPSHVTLIYPDTPISPYTWLQIADFGITVRGTSGIELGALGKAVITAGSGRYEDIGFTINSNSVDEYLSILSKVPDILPPTDREHEIAKRFAYASFCMKPFTLDFLCPKVRTGKKRIFNSDDLIYLANISKSKQSFPDSLERFYLWSLDKNSIDFLNAWPVKAM
jgi:hypothetical protein